MDKILLPHQLYFPLLDLAEDRATSGKKEDFLRSLNETTGQKKAMVYVHVPYCNSQCSFCGFNKSDQVSQAEAYMAALKKEIDFYASKAYVKNLEVTGIHIGGGTPTYLPREILGQLIDYIRDKFNASNADLNVEGSATTLDDQTIDLLIEKKVSRVSFGVQTFNEDLRRELNIKASLEEVLSTIDKLKSKGVTTYIDLMHGFPELGIEGQDKIAEEDARKAVGLGVDGLDFSQFYPFHNPLEARIRKDGLKFPSGAQVVQTIRAVTNVLESDGYIQTTEYGFCKKGEIMLEKSYFGEEKGISDCIALGPSSIGLLNGHRYRNIQHSLYCQMMVPALLQIKKLSEEDLQRAAFVGFPKVLRLAKSQLSVDLALEYGPRLEALITEGLVVEREDCFELTAEGKCYVSNVQLSMMSTEERKVVQEKLKILTLED